MAEDESDKENDASAELEEPDTPEVNKIPAEELKKKKKDDDEPKKNRKRKAPQKEEPKKTTNKV